ncbi:hypothetical protein [Pseudoruegeria sp. HB172150]|uniref:hypothetical protein n=1 Tax=Pseudoruegeria sp. HB172150 TaxID=2721164 RepID=UPI001C131E96|nr:hypothetical protein [Pseudoruegeria sp. HB172150]
MDKNNPIQPEFRSVMAPNGAMHVGVIDEAMALKLGRAEGLVRLLNGFDNGRHAGFGLAHIESHQTRKNYSTDKLGFRTLVHMVAFCCVDPDKISIGNNGRPILWRKKGHVWIKCVLDWSVERDCWHVITAIPTASSRDAPIWEKEAD